jgi:CheY-like chemotaxis protein
MAANRRRPAAESARYRLLGDQPDCGDDDWLGFGRVADDLTDLILDSRDRTPFTVGIKGNWGAGKSSLMRRLERRLDAHEAVVSVWFNAWTAERGDTLEGLVKSVLDKLDPNVLRKAARNKTFVTGLRLVVAIAAGWLRVGNVVDRLWERASVDPKARNKLCELLSDAMDDWIAKGPADAGHRVLVVFIDDLDRCSPDGVFQVFEAIKLYLDARGFVFVIGFDESIVSEAVLEQKQYARSVTSRAYLEKIVQIEYTIEDPDDEQVGRLMEAYAEESGTKPLLDASARTLIVEGDHRNPRRLKRFINSFVLEQQLIRNGVELEPGTLIRTLILRTYFPDFKRLFTEHTDPLEEFLGYLDVREAFLSGSVPEHEPRIMQFFTDHQTPVKPEPNLAELEKNLPESYPTLARKPDFVSLVRYLAEQSEREEVRSTLEKAPDSAGADVMPEAPAPGSAFAPGTAENLRGIRVLWVDDNAAQNQAIADRIRRQGGTVLTADDGAEAERVLASEEIDLLVSDIAREGREDAGLVDLERFRSEGLYDGPAIFFVARVTPARRERARALNASVTNEPSDLIRQIAARAPWVAVKQAHV